MTDFSGCENYIFIGTDGVLELLDQWIPGMNSTCISASGSQEREYYWATDEWARRPAELASTEKASRGMLSPKNFAKFFKISRHIESLDAWSIKYR
jgi:hypothetical protein